MSENGWIGRSENVIAGTYTRFPVVMVEGKGCRLKDDSGREYLDFVSGIAVCSLGHCHEAITAAVQNQVRQLVHVSNLFYTVPQIELAELLTANSFADRVFFANSGAEANEGAIKLARKYAGPGRYEIISLEGSFHGRTLSTVAATGQKKLHQGFEPMPEGFIHVPFGDMTALSKAVNEKTCAVLCEPIQGEGGVRPMKKEYLKAIRELCLDKNLLLILDEVQVGMGRTGSLFAYEQFGITPDIMTLAKALGNGLPIGAMLAKEAVASAFGPGTHASTFGGNPVSCAAATACLKIIASEEFLSSVREKGNYLKEVLQKISEANPGRIKEVRGMGLIQGLVLEEEWVPFGGKIVEKLFQKGVLVNLAAGKVLRLIPPLVVTRDEIDTLCDGLLAVFNELKE